MSAASTLPPPPPNAELQGPLDVRARGAEYHVVDVHGRVVATCTVREFAYLFAVSVNNLIERTKEPGAKLVLYARTEHKARLPDGGEVQVTYPANADVPSVIHLLDQIVCGRAPLGPTGRSMTLPDASELKVSFPTNANMVFVLRRLAGLVHRLTREHVPNPAQVN
ncbi:MAG: hypothetical protein KF782_15460 [Labilithrix sp.]|nr:hypothetical protein [Labilithrix sp.]